MNHMLKIAACVVVLATVSFVTAQDDAAGPGRGGRMERVRQPALLTVRGEARLEKPADQLQIALSVVNQGKEASQVLKENSKLTSSVIDAMKKAGLDDKEYETGNLSVHPVYSQRPSNKMHDEWHPEIVGFTAVHRLHVKTTKLELIGDIIGAASDAGVNAIDSIGFGLADPRTHRQEAIKAATANAVADAKTLAEAAGVRLVRVMSINLDDAQSMPLQPMMARDMMMMEAKAGGPPVQAGDVTVSSSVTVVYEIEQSE